MGERKVLNKYYPPDFDPELLPRNRKPKDRQLEVRIMIPFTLCCLQCKEFSYRGKKFNSKKEIAQDVNYLGLYIHRFFIKCPRCASEIVFRTDPENADYLMEHGATRNYEHWNDKARQEAAAKAERAEEDEGDSMRALENRAADSKVEMDILDAMDDVKTLNARHQKVDTGKILDKLREARQGGDKDAIELEDDEEDDALENVEFAANAKRIATEDEKRKEAEREAMREAAKAAVNAGAAAKAAGPKRLAGVTIKRKADDAPEEPSSSAKAAKAEEKKEDGPALSSLISYSDSGSGESD